MITASTPASVRRASNPHVALAIRPIGLSDLRLALERGVEDFRRHPSHYVFLALIYPVAGIAIALAATGANAFPVLFPLVAGFALLGPLAALGFYEVSRRAERGEPATWRDAFAIAHSPALPAIAKVALVLVALFMAWLVTAQLLFSWLAPPVEAASYPAFLDALFRSPAGWTLAILGNALGLGFAVVAFSLSVVSLPLILDRHVGAGEAMRVSLEAVRRNPAPMAVWGLIAGGLVFLGSLPLLVGLAVVLPVMGHATWHLYRRVIG